MKTQILLPEQTKEAATLIRKGGLVVFPTETVYGLGASAFNPTACARIYSAKGRPSDNPLIVHVASEEQLNAVVSSVPPKARSLIEAFWPGPLSLILPRSSDLPDIVTAGLPTVAVRWPRHAQALQFLLETGVAIAAPSANVSGAPSPTTFEMAKGAMLGRVDGILMGDDADEGLESTIVGFVGEEARIFRPGSITAEDLSRVLGVSADSLTYVPSAEGRPLSPGLKYAHYKPAAEVRLYRTVGALGEVAEAGEKVGVLVLGSADLPCPASWTVIRFDDLKAYAKGLYSSFFELDRVGCTEIWAPLPESVGLGTALANRLLKAAGGKLPE
ncbi:MAG: L-threonylcarbamoyladenylate synthase [Spirochaetales bacterium]